MACKQAIRIGRATARRTIGVADASGVIAIPPNYERVALVIASPSPTSTLCIKSLDVSDVPVTLWTGMAGQSALLRVEDWGQVIQGPLSAFDSLGGGAQYEVSELYLTQSLDNF